MTKYQVVLIPQEEGGYTVIVPALPGCVSQGETEKEALANIRDAIRGWLVVARKRNLFVPKPEMVKITTVGVAA
jgi:predicted RNase H-like HicB family nuclease